jgi:PAS domain S-box-containing protein
LEEKVAQRTTEYEEKNEQLKNEITKSQRLQEELGYSIRRWRETFDVMSDFVSVHDNNMKFVKANMALGNFLGINPKELIGKYCYELMHNTKEPWPTCPHLKAIERREIVTEEIEEPFLGKTLLVTCSPVFDKKGTPLGTVQVARDITDQKLAEKEREALVKELQATLNEIKVLRGILPICSFCKNIRNDEGYYEQIESYIHKQSGVDFSHTICPSCVQEHYPEEYNEIVLKKES